MNIHLLLGLLVLVTLSECSDLRKWSKGSRLTPSTTLSSRFFSASYIKPCSRGEKFEECALESAKYAIPHIVAGKFESLCISRIFSFYLDYFTGDKSLKIPSMKPLHILLIEVDTRKSFKLRMEDVDVYGLEHAVPVAVKYLVNKSEYKVH